MKLPSGYKWFFALTAPVFFLVATLCYGIPLKQKVPAFYVTTLAGSGRKGNKDGIPARASFNWPTGVAAAADGTVYVADFSNNTIRKIDPETGVTTFAGSGRPGYADGLGVGAILKGPDNIAIDPEGNIFVADADNFRIRKISPDGAVTTVAGNGLRGYRDGEATEAMFGYPTGIAVDAEANLYVADRRTHTVRKITPGGQVLTLAGNGQSGYADGKGRASHLREPISIAVNKDGTVYVADSGNNAIREITPDGTITTLAGGKDGGYRDGVGKEARFAWPTGIAVDTSGNIYVCDSHNNKIRRITPAGVVSTIAGGSLPGSSNGPGWRARFNFPTGIWVDSEGNVYVADSGNNMIRKIIRGEVTAAGLRQ
jgi:sugar lactone lactonase YvrE